MKLSHLATWSKNLYIAWGVFGVLLVINFVISLSGGHVLRSLVMTIIFGGIVVILSALLRQATLWVVDEKKTFAQALFVQSLFFILIVIFSLITSLLVALFIAKLLPIAILLLAGSTALIIWAGLLLVKYSFHISWKKSFAVIMTTVGGLYMVILLIGFLAFFIISFTPWKQVLGPMLFPASQTMNMQENPMMMTDVQMQAMMQQLQAEADAGQLDGVVSGEDLQKASN